MFIVLGVGLSFCSKKWLEIRAQPLSFLLLFVVFFVQYIIDIFKTRDKGIPLFETATSPNGCHGTMIIIGAKRWYRFSYFGLSNSVSYLLEIAQGPLQKKRSKHAPKSF